MFPKEVAFEFSGPKKENWVVCRFTPEPPPLVPAESQSERGAASCRRSPPFPNVAPARPWASREAIGRESRQAGRTLAWRRSPRPRQQEHVSGRAPWAEPGPVGDRGQGSRSGRDKAVGGGPRAPGRAGEEPSLLVWGGTGPGCAKGSAERGQGSKQPTRGLGKAAPRRSEGSGAVSPSLAHSADGVRERCSPSCQNQLIPPHPCKHWGPVLPVSPFPLLKTTRPLLKAADSGGLLLHAGNPSFKPGSCPRETWRPESPEEQSSLLGRRHPRRPGSQVGPGPRGRARSWGRILLCTHNLHALKWVFLGAQALSLNPGK